MLKTLIAAIIALLAGAGAVTLKKDKVILELKRENTRLNSYDHFSSIYQDAYDTGYRRGAMDQSIEDIQRYANRG